MVQMNLSIARSAYLSGQRRMPRVAEPAAISLAISTQVAVSLPSLRNARRRSGGTRFRNRRSGLDRKRPTRASSASSARSAVKSSHAGASAAGLDGGLRQKYVFPIRAHDSTCQNRSTALSTVADFRAVDPLLKRRSSDLYRSPFRGQREGPAVLIDKRWSTMSKNDIRIFVEQPTQLSR